MPSDLSALEIDEVSPVRKPATGIKFALLKADDGSLELAQGVVDALSTPAPNEDAFVSSLDASLSDDAREAAVCAFRLLAAYGNDFASVAKSSWPGFYSKKDEDLAILAGRRTWPPRKTAAGDDEPEQFDVAKSAVLELLTDALGA